MQIDYINLISKNIVELQNLILSLKEEEILMISKISSLVTNTLKSGGCIFWCGNGGSASDSQHLAAELIGRFKNNREPYKSISLTADSAVITCISNDFGYENLFSRQLEGLGNKGDLVITLSTSGNSMNLKNLLEKAKEKEINSVAILGKGGGLIKDLADLTLIINSDSTARIQEVHILIGHIICQIVEEELNGT